MLRRFYFFLLHCGLWKSLCGQHLVISFSASHASVPSAEGYIGILVKVKYLLQRHRQVNEFVLYAYNLLCQMQIMMNHIVGRDKYLFIYSCCHVNVSFERNSVTLYNCCFQNVLWGFYFDVNSKNNVCYIVVNPISQTDFASFLLDWQENKKSVRHWLIS